jgi:hypothetical protein
LKTLEVEVNGKENIYGVPEDDGNLQVAYFIAFVESRGDFVTNTSSDNLPEAILEPLKSARLTIRGRNLYQWNG